MNCRGWRVVVACLGLVTICGCGNLLPTLDDLILRPDTRITVTPADLGYPYEERTIEVSDDGRSVVIWHVRSDDSRALVVVIPGSSDNKSLYVQSLPMLVDSGYDVVLMDYEGFGNSPGQATLQHAADSAGAVVRWAMTRHERVALFGISLGSPLAIRAASEHEVVAVAVEGVLVLPSAAKLLADLDPQRQALYTLADLLLNTPLVPDDFDVLKYAPNANGAKLILYSPEDTLTPQKGALKVYEALPPPKMVFQTYGGHGQIYFLLPRTLKMTIGTWLDAVVANSPSTGTERPITAAASGDPRMD